MSSDAEDDDGFSGAFDEEFAHSDDELEQQEQAPPAAAEREAHARQRQQASAEASTSEAAGQRRTPQSQGPPMQRPAAASHAAHAGPPPCGRCLLPQMPREVLIRVMSFLSAQDLTSIAACSRQLHAAAGEDLLWRRLFCARWGKPKQPLANSIPWKGRYVDADSEESHQTVTGAPEELRAVFSDMQRAKRQTCLGRALVDDLAVLPQCQRHRKLTEWRREKGFSEAPVAKPDLARATLRFHRIEPDTFVCEDTGWVHLCDLSCREGIIDSDSGLITCPISGRTSLRLMAPHEEESMQQRSIDACFAAADQELQAFSVAKAYTEGYYSSAKEMRQRFGVKFR